MIYPITAAMVVYADETNCYTTADLRWSQMSDGLRCEAKRSQTTGGQSTFLGSYAFRGTEHECSTQFSSKP